MYLLQSCTEIFLCSPLFNYFLLFQFMCKVKCTVVPSSKYPFISASLLDAPQVLPKVSCGTEFQHEIIIRTYTLYLHARCKVGVISPLDHCEGKNSGNPEDRGGMLLRNTETTFQLHIKSVNKRQSCVTVSKRLTLKRGRNWEDLDVDGRTIWKVIHFRIGIIYGLWWRQHNSADETVKNTGTHFHCKTPNWVQKIYKLTVTKT